MNQLKDHEQRRGSATHTKLGTYLYGIFILCGLVIQDQKESLRRKYGYKAGNSINPMIGHMAWFWYEWLHIDNIKLIGIFIGVAIIVPTAISPLDFTRQSVWRTLVSGRLACSWIHRQINMLYQQGLHRCTVFAQSLTVHFWIIRSTNQGVRYVWDPGPPVWDPGTHDTMGTAKADPQTTLSDSVNRNHKQSKVAVSFNGEQYPHSNPDSAQ